MFQLARGVKRPRAGVDGDVEKLHVILGIREEATNIMMDSILKNCGPIAGSSLGPVQTSGDGSLCTTDRGNISHHADLAYMILGPA